jgi:hypothetical protein
MRNALLRCAASLALALGLAACGAVYPELTTPMRMPVAAQQIDPPPPPDVFWVAVLDGVAPERTRDGRTWQELGGKLPDPYVVLFLNGKEFLRTNPQSNTLHPTWPDSPRGNFRVQRGDKLRVEMWHEALVRTPICVKNVGGDVDDWVETRKIHLNCEGGAEINIAWEPAHARIGYGFYYELRTENVHVSRVFEESPAARAGMKVGDQIVSVNGNLTRGMKAGEIQGFFNAQRTEGVEIEFSHGPGQNTTVTLKEGPIYPLFSEVGSMP